MKSLVHHQVFGSNASPTIYYFIGYGGRIQQFHVHIKRLVRAGFRVVAFEYEKTIVDSGIPQSLLDSLHEMVAVVDTDKVNRSVAGVYGISLGTWLGFNVLLLCHLSKGIFVAGGVNIVNTIWSKPNLRIAKQNFIKNGYNQDDLHELLKNYDFSIDSSRIENKNYILINSTHDEVIDFEEAHQNFTSWSKVNPSSKFITHRYYKHWQVIVRSLLSVKSTVDFFRD